MSIAQQLYEGVDVKGHGTIGLITYMRTDSVRISTEAQIAALDFIKNKYGEKYVPETPRIYKGKKNIQDAHEAIRPTYADLTPEELKESLKDEQFKLYTLIWNRFIASQMAACLLDTTTVDVANDKYLLKAHGSIMKFEGFMKVYDYMNDDEDEGTLLPELAEKEVLTSKNIEGKQHFTQPPPHFSEASLVKTLEENGIGRPSTYAPTISTILDRKYVEKVKKNLTPTELGYIVNNIVSEYFKQIVDVEFTAEMEDKLDNIEEGKEKWSLIVDEFFKPLKVSIDIAEKEIAKITIEDKVSDVPCDKCGKMMVIKHGRFGDFLACPGYPECKNTKPIVEELAVSCPKCGGKLVAKRSKKGNRFYGCTNYPECNFVSWFEPAGENCPQCGSYMVKRYNKTKGNYLQCSNDSCKYKKDSTENSSSELSLESENN
jgi:Topoisomerase IA